MPVLRNYKHERFAQGIAKGKTQPEAYAYAGYKAADPKNLQVNSGHMARRPDVAERIAELQAKQAERIGITVDDLIRQLDEMYLLARNIKQPSAGVGAVLAKGKLLGLITDRVETDVNLRKPSREPTEEKRLTLDEWAEKFAPKPSGQAVQ